MTPLKGTTFQTFIVDDFQLGSNATARIGQGRGFGGGGLVVVVGGVSHNGVYWIFRTSEKF